MPIKKLCSHPSCLRIRLEGSLYCEKHQQDQIERDRRKAEYDAKRFERYKPKYQDFYQSARWKRERKEFLKQNPYCIYCGDLASQIHHEWNGVVYNTEEMFFDQSHWQPLCFKCHQKRHQQR